MKLSFKSIFYALGSLLFTVAILHFAKSLLIPLIFGLLLSFIFYPLVKWLSSKGIKKPWSIIMVMGGVTLVGLGIVFLFSAQIVSMAKGYRQFLDKLREVADTSIRFFNDNVSIIPDIDYNTITEGLTSFFADSGLVIVSDTIRLTSSFVTYLSLSVIYTFLILLYNESLTNAMTRFAAPKQRDNFRAMLKDVQQVGQQYLIGMVILVGILSILNSIGLLILGIEYAIFFGFLAGLLAILPYVGTLIGGLIPTVFALVTYDSLWYPAGVIGIFWLIQFLEGNFLNPKIVGGSLHVNALFSIISLIAGGLLWGIPGMILFLPLMAVIRVVCSYFKKLEPLAMIIGDGRQKVE